MGRRKDRARTPGLWIAANELPPTGGHPFYQRLNQVLGRARLRRLRRSAVRPVLCDDDRPPESDAGHLLPAAADWLLRGHRLGTRDRLADRRFARAAWLPGRGSGRRDARALDDLADATPDRSWKRTARCSRGSCRCWRSRISSKGRRWDRCDHAGSQCGHAEDRAARHGRDVPGVSDATGAGLGHRDADAGRSGAARSEARRRTAMQSGGIRTIPTRGSRR